MTKRMIAAAAGDTFYMADRPCKQGHEPKRYTSNGMCVQCLKNHSNTLKQARIALNTNRFDGFSTTAVVTRPNQVDMVKRFEALLRNGTPDQVKVVGDVIESMTPAVATTPPPTPMRMLTREKVQELIAAKPWDFYYQTLDTKYVQFGEDWYDIDDVQRAVNGTVNFIFAGSPDPSTIY